MPTHGPAGSGTSTSCTPRLGSASPGPRSPTFWPPRHRDTWLYGPGRRSARRWSVGGRIEIATETSRSSDGTATILRPAQLNIAELVQPRRPAGWNEAGRVVFLDDAGAGIRCLERTAIDD